MGKRINREKDPLANSQDFEEPLLHQEGITSTVEEEENVSALSTGENKSSVHYGSHDRNEDYDLRSDTEYESVQGDGRANKSEMGLYDEIVREEISKTGSDVPDNDADLNMIIIEQESELSQQSAFRMDRRSDIFSSKFPKGHKRQRPAHAQAAPTPHESALKFSGK